MTIFNNKTISLVIFVFTALVFFVCPTSGFASSAWQNVGTVGFSEGYSAYLSLVFPPNSSTPYVAFTDDPNEGSGRVTVMRYDGADWVSVGNPEFSEGYSEKTSLAFPPNSSTPYVAYVDVPNNYGVTVMRYDGADWVSVGAPAFSNPSRAISLAFPPNSSTPYVALDSEAVYDNEIVIMRYDGADWVSVGPTIEDPSGTGSISLAFPSNRSTPYIAYQYNDLVKVMRYDGADWVSVGADIQSGTFVSKVSLAFPSNSSTPYVAFENRINNIVRPTVMRYDGADWVSVGTPGFWPRTVESLSLAFPPNSSTPYVAFTDDPNIGEDAAKVIVMRYDGADWVSVDAPVSASPAYYTSLAFPPNSSTPYVAYADVVSDEKAVVMKYDVVAYNLSFDTQGGSFVAPMTVEEGEIVILPEAPLRSGYIFQNWNTDLDGNGNAYDASVSFAMPGEDSTLYAIWEEVGSEGGGDGGETMEGGSVIYGAAWSDNIGWISFNNCIDSSESNCTPVSYEVLVDSQGNISGEAWSDNIGWIKFGGLSGFPIGGGTVSENAKIDFSDGRITGWARACSGTIPGDCSSMNSRTDGWDGWISLSGTEHTSPEFNGNGGVTYDNSIGKIIGKAWGSEVVGWIDFGGVTSDPPNVFLDFGEFAYELTNSTIQAVEPQIPRGSAGNAGIVMEWVSGATEEVTLSAPGSLDGGNITVDDILENNPCEMGPSQTDCSSTVTIRVGLNATLGVNSFEVSGLSDSGVEESTQVSFEVVESEPELEISCFAQGGPLIYQGVTWVAEFEGAYSQVDWGGDMGLTKVGCSNNLVCNTAYPTVGVKQVQISIDESEYVDCAPITIIANLEFKEI